jgi:mannose-6-phosphate isomerase-like protein (cupin superfamily)
MGKEHFVWKALGGTVLIGAVALVSAQAQNNPKAPRDEALYISAEQLQIIEQGAPVSSETGKPGAFSKRLFSDTTFSTAYIRLETGDQPHAHGSWSEVFVVTEGAGVLETGGTITGVTGHDSATHKSLFIDPQQPQSSMTPVGPVRNGSPGDVAGTAIEGGHKQQVKAGDVILIPAGVPHHWLQVDQPIVYLDTKFPKAE